jgi:hypothetical protein
LLDSLLKEIKCGFSPTCRSKESGNQMWKDKRRAAPNMNLVSGVLFSTFLFGGISINKYVLSVLGFKYPTIFQGWNTLAGLFVYKILSILKKSDYPLTPVDRAGFVSLLPGLLFHTTALIANSKALADIPVSVYISVQNTLPAGIYLLDRVFPGRPPTPPLQGVCSVITLLTGIGLVVVETSLDFQDSAYFWIIVGVSCTVASTLHSRIADARFSSWDRLYYSAVFSVILLAPASLYLEEAFQALHFRHDKQGLFLTGCLFSAMFTACYNIYSVRLKEEEYFGLLLNVASAGTAIVSIFLFSSDLKWWQWTLIGVNLASTIPLPSHQGREEDLPVGVFQGEGYTPLAQGEAVITRP